MSSLARFPYIHAHCLLQYIVLGEVYEEYWTSHSYVAGKRRLTLIAFSDNCVIVVIF